MKPSLFCFFFVIFSAVWSQPERLDSNSIIFVQGTESRITAGQPASDPRKGDFYRNLMVSRMVLNDQANRPLLRIRNGSQGHLTLAEALVSGMKKGKIQAVHPSNLRIPYRYFDLVDDLANLNGVDRSDTVYWDQLGAEFLDMRMDLIYEKGFSSDYSREFFRPKFLRLIWFNPGDPRGPSVLAVFPFDEIRPFLAGLEAESEQGWHRSVAEIFDLHLFSGRDIPIHLDPARYPPVQRRN